MLTIYLARHGQDLDNVNGILNGRRDMPLTEKGVEQAGIVAEELQQTGIKIDKIYSSPLKRAYHTAEIIAETLGVSKPEKLDGLIERDFGVMTGKPQAEIENLCAPDILKTDTVTYFLSPEGAETFPQLVDRARLTLNSIRRAHQDGNILLVSHGDIGKMIYCAYYNLAWQEILTMFHFGNSEILVLSPRSDPKDVYLIRTAQYNL
ncbi:MAG: histidine phosphatase family protein [Candidatus Berkelbacteria bacterium]|nr:MAG: histidine phosphatase family protein [Candidatus Berkelbacteria bacterium]QQG51807.1 MAG: histidine phosphatase family protein [Candidatus Berkelbacteria bacterium]